MKRFIGAALVLSLLGSTAAVAQPYDRGYDGQGYQQGYQQNYQQQDYRQDDRRSDNSGAVLFGVGLLALTALAISQGGHSHRDHWNGYRGHEGFRGR